MNRCLIILSCLLLLGSCRSKQAAPEIHISGSAAFHDVSVSWPVSCRKDTITVLNGHDSVYFNQYDDTIRHFLRKGRGPLEAMNIASASSIGDYLAVIDHSGYDTPKSLFFIDLRDPSNQDKWQVISLEWLNNFYVIPEFVMLDKGHMVALTWEKGEDAIMTWIDLENQTTHRLDFDIQDSYTGNPNRRNLLYTLNSRVSYNREKSKLVYTCGEGCYMEIMTLHDGIISDRQTILGTVPDFREDGDKLRMNDRKNRGIRMWSTDNHIFITYNNPFENRSYKGYPGYFTDYIDVFDWDGRKVCRLLPDQPFSTFCVSEDDAILYTVTMDRHSSEEEIWKYPLVLPE